MGQLALEPTMLGMDSDSVAEPKQADIPLTLNEADIEKVARLERRSNISGNIASKLDLGGKIAFGVAGASFGKDLYTGQPASLATGLSFAGGALTGTGAWISGALSNSYHKAAHVHSSYTSSRAKFFDKLELKYDQPRPMDIEDRSILAAMDTPELDTLPKWMQCEAYMTKRNIGLAAMVSKGREVDEMTLTLGVDYKNDDIDQKLEVIKGEYSEALESISAYFAVDDHQYEVAQNFTNDLLADNAAEFQRLMEKEEAGETLTAEEEEFCQTTPFFAARLEEDIRRSTNTTATLAGVAVAGTLIDHAAPDGNDMAGAAGAAAGLALIVHTGIEMAIGYHMSVGSAKHNLQVDHQIGLGDASKARVDLRSDFETVQSADKFADDIKSENAGEEVVSFYQKPITLAHRIGLIN